MKLVQDWKSAYKWLTIHLSILGIVATGMWDYIPTLQTIIPAPLMTKITLGLFGAIMIARIIKQGKDDAGVS